MPKLSNLVADKTKRVLVYGPPKSGKTQLVGNLAEKFNLIWFDLESGHDTLFKLPKEWQERIEVIAIPDTRGYPMAIETCLKVIRGEKVTVCVEHGKVNCPQCMDLKNKVAKDGKEVSEVHLNGLSSDSAVVFDSLTQLTNSAIANITRNKPDDYKLTYDDWGNLGKVLDTFLSYVQNAPYNVICISHENAVEMVDGKEKIVPTAGTRNFSRNSAKYFGEVIYCEVVNKAHKFASSTTYKNNVLTGSRAGKVTEEGTGHKLLELWEE
jgi:hypothetical protein